MPSACDPVRAALAAYRDGGDPPDRSADGAVHLEACDECRTALEDLVGASDEQVVAQAFATARVGDGFAARVTARLADETGSQAPAAAVEDSSGEEEDEELAELLAAGARYAGSSPAGRSGMGMVIEYCSTCRERIDAADFKTGAAIQFRGQNYCSTCKAEVLPELEDDPEFIEQQERRQRDARRKSDRQPATGIGSGIRPGMGRAVRQASGPSGGGGPNIMMIGGIAAGVLVLIVAVVLMIPGDSGSSGGGNDSGTRTAKNRNRGKSKSKDRSKSKSKQSTGNDTPVSSGDTNKPSMEQIMAVRTALKSLREKRTEAEEFAKKNGEPGQWQNVDLHYKNLLEDSAWNDPAIQDNPEVKELRESVEADRKLARDRFEGAGRELISKHISRAIFFASREDFGRAMHMLDEIPPMYHHLEEYKKEVPETRVKIDKMAREKMGEIGKWIDLTHDTWKLQPPHQVIKGDDGATVLKGVGDKMGLGIFTSNSSSNWGDYEIEMEAKLVYPADAQNMIKMGLRVTRNSETNQLQGAAFGFKPEFAGDYRKFLIKVEGDKVSGTMDGQTVQESDTRGNWRGKPILLIPPGCELHIKSARVKLLAFGKRPGG